MKTHFAMMASYNAWANARLFRMAGALADELCRKEVGAYLRVSTVPSIIFSSPIVFGCVA